MLPRWDELFQDRWFYQQDFWGLFGTPDKRWCGGAVELGDGWAGAALVSAALSGVGSAVSRKEEFAENKFDAVEQSVPLKCVLQPE